LKILNIKINKNINKISWIYFKIMKTIKKINKII
jgi:hypothetical protein